MQQVMMLPMITQGQRRDNKIMAITMIELK
jgi:hypothetical protein